MIGFDLVERRLYDTTSSIDIVFDAPPTIEEVRAFEAAQLDKGLKMSEPEFYDGHIGAIALGKLRIALMEFAPFIDVRDVYHTKSGKSYYGDSTDPNEVAQYFTYDRNLLLNAPSQRIEASKEPDSSISVRYDVSRVMLDRYPGDLSDTLIDVEFTRGYAKVAKVHSADCECCRTFVDEGNPIMGRHNTGGIGGIMFAVAALAFNHDAASNSL